MLNPQELFKIYADDEFQSLINADETIKALDSLKYNKKQEYQALLQVLDCVNILSGIPIYNLTPAIFSLLWVIENPYARGSYEEIKQIDTDIFLYLISKNIDDFETSLIEIATNATGFCQKNNLDYQEVKNDIIYLISLSFKALQFLPQSNFTKEKAQYGALWVAQISSIVAKEMNISTNQVVFKTSLCKCFYYYISFLKKEDTKNIIKRRNNMQIQGAIYQRTMEIAENYYLEKYGDEK